MPSKEDFEPIVPPNTTEPERVISDVELANTQEATESIQNTATESSSNDESVLLDASIHESSQDKEPNSQNEDVNQATINPRPTVIEKGKYFI